jgi:hypothetical protein
MALLDPLPWLLDWPPSRGAVVAFVLVTAFSVGTLALFGGVTDDLTGGNVTVAETDLTVRLNDEFDLPDTNGSVETCFASGTPGDSVAVTGDVTLDVPAEWGGRSDERRPVLAVSLEHTGEETTERVERTGRVTTDVFWVLDDDESLAVGETARVQIRVRAGGSTVATANRTVTVRNGSRSYDC